jgi:hypothetical protein
VEGSQDIQGGFNGKSMDIDGLVFFGPLVKVRFHGF